MKVSEYLKNSGLQATASVTFNDLTEILDGAPPPPESSAGTAPDSPAAGAPPVIATATPATAAPAAAAPATPAASGANPTPTPATASSSDVNARLVARLQAEFPDDYARLQSEVAGESAAS